MFGTDGVRGLVNQYPMTVELATRFGMASGVYLKQKESVDKGRLRVVMSKDTRLSGYLLESALIAGFVAVGVDVTIVGPMPTPAVPMLIRSLRADFGVMITASHNPYHDNGFKLFHKNGCKISRTAEEKIEDLIASNKFDLHLAHADDLGRVTRLEDASGRYIEHVKSALPKGLSLSGLRIVLDCAHGAGYKVGPTILWELGAEVIVINDKPNGMNINALSGSLYPQAMIKKVIQTRADIGIALDGDADRVLICDESGVMIDGDHMIAAIVKYCVESNRNRDISSIVVTEISNGALEKYMKNFGIAVWYSKVGDRNVADEMIKRKSQIGGESSGHVIASEYGMTSDGLVAALHLLAAMIVGRKKASEFTKIFPLCPQFKANVHYYGNNPSKNVEVIAAVESIAKNNCDMRIIVRGSGTEDVVRIIVEGEELDKITLIGESIKAVLLKHMSDGKD